MTIWYTEETWGSSGARHAGNKAREDVSAILSSLAERPLEVVKTFDGKSAIEKSISHYRRFKQWKNSLSVVSKGDIVVFQLPLISHTVFSPLILNYCQANSIKTVALIHDVEALRMKSANYLPMQLKCEEISFLKQCDCVICHNESMKQELVKKFDLNKDKCIVLGLFDYLIPDDLAPNNDQFGLGKPIVIAGNLSAQKAGYLYTGPLPFEANLYGVNFDEKNTDPNMHYHGSFLPDELPRAIKGSFGLVWDGDSRDGCSGDYGDYLRINNPHKASLYLACGLPIIVWSESALATFVTGLGVGFVVDSLDDVTHRIDMLEYAATSKMYSNARALSKRLRSGSFLKAAIDEAEFQITRKANCIG